MVCYYPKDKEVFCGENDYIAVLQQFEFRG